MAANRRAMKRLASHGFTLIELIMVMVILGILAVAVIPRFTDRKTFEARGFYDQAQSTLRYAQKTAIAQHAPVFVNIAVGTISLSYASAANCSATATFVPNPANGKDYVQNAPTGITFSSATQFCFDGLGKPYKLNDIFPTSSLAAPITITIGVVGDGLTRTITIERETGFVH